MHTHLLCFGFCYRMGHDRLLRRVPWAAQQALTLYLFYIKWCLVAGQGHSVRHLASASGASEELVNRTDCFLILQDHCSDFFVCKQPFFSLSCYYSCFLLAALCSMWDLNSLTGDGTRAPCSGSAVLAAGPPGKPHFSALPRSHLGLNPGSAGCQPGDIRTLVSSAEN